MESTKNNAADATCSLLGAENTAVAMYEKYSHTLMCAQASHAHVCDYVLVNAQHFWQHCLDVELLESHLQLNLVPSYGQWI